MAGDPTLYPIKHPIAEQFGERHLTIQEQDLFHKALRRTAAETPGRTMTMTTPTPAPAPMTAEQLERMRKWVAAIPDGSYEQHTTGADACKVLLAHIDTLTARVAELERERDARGEEFATALAGLQSELAAARKVEDEEVKRWVSNLQAAGGNQGTFTESERLRYRTLADLLTRLSSALKEAERRSLDNAVRAHGWMVQHDALLGFIQARQSVLNELIDNDPRPASPKPSDVPDIIARAQSAEAKLETARRDALEEAALTCEYIRDAQFDKLPHYADEPDFSTEDTCAEDVCAWHIRALQTKDTTP